MKALKATLAVMCFTICVATAVHAQERMRTGMWENTVTGHGQTATRSHCYKPADAAASNGSPAAIRAEVEKALAKSGACTLKDFKLEGSTMTQTMVCGNSTLVNETKFHGGDSFETTITRTADGVTTVSQIKGRRTGDCKPVE